MNCKPGYHFVRQHKRKSKNGTMSIVDAHCRKNSKNKKSFLFKSNLSYIYTNSKSIYKYKRLPLIQGFKKDQGQYDRMIQFWLKYWKDQGLIKDDIDPILIKALIAIESSFREQVITSMPNSSATGLMQIVKTTLRILSQKQGKEVRKFNIDVSQKEIQDANTNIAVGTRWLVYKITTSPWKNKKSYSDRIFGGLKFYHSWDKYGEEYANKVLSLYEKSKK